MVIIFLSQKESVLFTLRCLKLDLALNVNELYHMTLLNINSGSNLIAWVWCSWSLSLNVLEPFFFLKKKRERSAHTSLKLLLHSVHCQFSHQIITCVNISPKPPRILDNGNAPWPPCIQIILRNDSEISPLDYSLVM